MASIASSSSPVIDYCKVGQCKLCKLKQLDTNPKFEAYLTLKQHELNNTSASCKSKDCIYMISCKEPNCPVKYIGKTTNRLNKRLSGYRSNIINKTEGYPMWYHFTKYHTITDMVIKPIEFCSPKDLSEREKFWMREINTIYPYGLNDRIDIDGIHDAYSYVINNGPKFIYSLFNKVTNNRTKKGGQRHAIRNTNVTLTASEFQPDTYEGISGPKMHDLESTMGF